MLSAWLLWSLLVALLVLPVVLRVYVGDDGPSNEIVQEQHPDGQEDGRAELRAAA